jgi:hypothetical protein
MNFPILYTGKDTGVRIPEFDKLERSERSLHENVKKGAEEQYKRKKEDEAWFLEMAKSDPKLLINDKLREKQAAAIEEYNNVGAQMWSRAKENGLSMQDKLTLQRHKDALTTFQDKLLSNQKRWESELGIMQKDSKEYYDPKFFAEAQKQLWETGEYPTTGLVPKPQDILTAILSDKTDFGETFIPSIKDPSTGKFVSATANMTEDQARYLVAAKALSNSAYMRDVIDKFNELPESEQDKYLTDYDVNKNGKIDPAEKKTALAEPSNWNNPILKWAQDRFAPDVRKINYGAPSALPSASGGGGLYGTDKSPMQMSTNKTFGSTTYSEYYNNPKRTTTNTPLQGGRVLRETGDMELKRDKTTQGLILTGVGVKEDGKVELTFALPSDNYMNIGASSGTNVALPAENYPEYQNMRIIKDGKSITVKDLLKGQATTQPKSAEKSAAERMRELAGKNQVKK